VNIEQIKKSSKKLNLLYVEDNIAVRTMTMVILKQFFDNIILAEDGQDGILKFKENNIDLIITDLNMPNMGGLEMSKKIKEINEDIPILVLSAHDDVEFFLESIKIGIDGYLLKPVDLEQLSSILYKVIQKINFEKEAKENLHFLETYKHAINMSSIVSKTDPKGIITYVNDNFCKISGYKREELIGKPHNIVRHPDNPKSMFKEMWHTIKDKKEIWRGIVRNITRTGKSYYVESVVVPILDLDGNIIEYISLRTDITHIMNPENQLKDAIKNSKDSMLIYFKLEQYDMIEEFYDNERVSLIEEEAYKYLQSKFSKYYEFDTLYKLNQGEYAFLVNKTKYLTDIRSFVKELKNIQEEIKDEAISIEDIEYDIAIIISVVFESDKVLESARLGLKKLIKNNQDFIVANNLAKITQEKAKNNMKTLNMIKKALNNSRIVSYFQPIIYNKTKTVVKYESLVRLIDDNDKVLTPYFFLDVAKKSNYYPKITAVVLEHSFKMLKKCDADVSINLSALDIEQKSTRKKIFELLEIYKKDAHRIVFELLEDENIKNFSLVTKFITLVKEYGVSIAIDDFGAGYSNFERLLDYQPDILKIDGSLIRNIETSEYSLSVVKSIVTFAKEQNIQTVAEFIENEKIYEITKNLGIDFSQGYCFGKPEPLEKLCPVKGM